MRALRIVGIGIASLAGLLALVWACAALWIDGPASRPLAAALAAAVGLAGLAVVAVVRPARRAAMALLMLVGAVALWWSALPPRNDRRWLPDVARPPVATIDGSRVTIANVRNFDYRSETDFDERWETRSFDLDALRGVDMFLSYWGSPHIAHTIASWDFGAGQHLAISIETRKEEGEAYSALLGFFRQYELYYVVADERDVIGVRAAHRGEDVYRYPIRLPADRARAILLDYLATINRLAQEPRWYNALTHNCTTTIRDHVMHVMPRNPWSWKILANGHLDELWYEREIIDTSRPFAEVRAGSNVTARARAAAGAADFSTRIRGPLGADRPPGDEHG